MLIKYIVPKDHRKRIHIYAGHTDTTLWTWCAQGLHIDECDGVHDAAYFRYLDCLGFGKLCKHCEKRDAPYEYAFPINEEIP